MILGVRREDKSRFERRVPLVPEDARALIAGTPGVAVVVQPSPHRAFSDGEYAAAGARLCEDLSGCDVVLAVKEVPAERLRPGGAYLFFSHTIKGQAHNMPLLRALLDRGCTLIDYERIVDGRGARKIGFSRHAGLAGMVDALWALGERLRAEGVDSPLAALRPAHAWPDLGAARAAVRAAGAAIAAGAWPAAVPPLVVGLVGYGNVSRGAQAILDDLPIEALDPDRLLAGPAPDDPRRVHQVVFEERHTVERADGGPFSLDEYFAHPDRYRSKFDPALGRIGLLVNCVYWEPRCPRLVTRRALREAAARGAAWPRVIADISCDLEGAIEVTVRATSQDSPVYVWDAAGERAIEGCSGPGPVILAVDNLPCEIPVEASRDFSAALAPMLPALCAADLSAPSPEDAGLPPDLAGAAIVWRGALTPRYRYLQDHLRAVGA